MSFCGNYILTVFVAIVATLAFESPIVTIEKMIFAPAKKPEISKRNNNNEVEPDRSQNNIKEMTSE